MDKNNAIYMSTIGFPLDQAVDALIEAKNNGLNVYTLSSDIHESRKEKLYSMDVESKEQFFRDFLHKPYESWQKEQKLIFAQEQRNAIEMRISVEVFKKERDLYGELKAVHDTGFPPVEFIPCDYDTGCEIYPIFELDVARPMMLGLAAGQNLYCRFEGKEYIGSQIDSMDDMYQIRYGRSYVDYIEERYQKDKLSALLGQEKYDFLKQEADFLYNSVINRIDKSINLNDLRREADLFCLGRVPSEYPWIEDQIQASVAIMEALDNKDNKDVELACQLLYDIEEKFYISHINDLLSFTHPRDFEKFKNRYEDFKYEKRDQY